MCLFQGTPPKLWFSFWFPLRDSGVLTEGPLRVAEVCRVVAPEEAPAGDVGLCVLLESGQGKTSAAQHVWFNRPWPQAFNQLVIFKRFACQTLARCQNMPNVLQRNITLSRLQMRHCSQAFPPFCCLGFHHSADDWGKVRDVLRQVGKTACPCSAMSTAGETDGSIGGRWFI